MEDYNTATLPHEKYIDLEKWEMAEYNRELIVSAFSLCVHLLFFLCVSAFFAVSRLRPHVRTPENNGRYCVRFFIFLMVSGDMFLRLTKHSLVFILV